MKSISHQFLDFCRSKPADEEYDYTDIEGCAFCQFLRHAGYPVVRVWPNHWSDSENNIHKMPDGVERMVIHADPYALNCGRTFGALADRLAERLGVK